MMTRRRGLLLAACSLPVALWGCSQAESAPALRAAEYDPATACDFDGMLLADYPGPKAQVFYAGAAAPVFFCDTVEMFSALLKPEQVRAVRAVFTQDMAQADWEQPRGHWFDARSGFYVIGSKRHGSMGPTFASFAARPAAEKFAAEFGGKVMAYAEVSPDMAELCGGAQHDQRM
jgi:copper chaperone NosL